MASPEHRYLYKQRGPWPQPNPLGATLFPAVLHLPLRERLQWFARIGARYVRQMIFYSPIALIYGLRNPGPRIVGDHEFEERFDNTVFNKMIVPFKKGSAHAAEAAGDSPADSMQVPWQLPVQETQSLLTTQQQSMAEQMAWRRFPEQMAKSTPSEETRYFIADFSIFEELPTFPGTFSAGTTALFKRDAPNARLDVVSIRINGLELTPADGDAWQLAKLYVMQGATIRIVYSTHALLHFPEDSINAISKARLPIDHVLHQLLIPHTDLQLVLDSKVQTAATSPLINNQIFPSSPHTGPVSGLVRTLEQLYNGVEGNPAYPPYHYKHPRRSAEEKYVNFLEAYYQTILAFVRKVLVKVEDGDPFVIDWANYVSQHVPGFPDGKHIFEPYEPGSDMRNLDWAVATFIWDVSVGHTTDHYNMGLLDINENPFRIRVPPPRDKQTRFDPKDLRHWPDFFRYRLFWKMFLKSTTVFRLQDVRYPFSDPDLRRHNEEFLVDLRRTAESLAPGEFIPLREIARSVQF